MYHVVLLFTLSVYGNPLVISVVDTVRHDNDKSVK